MCFRQTIVYISTQRMQGYLPLHLFFTTSDFSSTKSSPNDDANALCICTHCFLHRLLHCATKRDALLQLLRNTPPNQVCIQFRLANLYNIQTHALFGFRLERRTQLIYLLTTFANYDTWFRRMNSYRHLVRSCTLNLNARDRSVGKFFLDELAQHEIFCKQILIITLSVPARLPAFHDAEPETSGMHFVTQKCPPS
jgi:hypothetical protein